MTKKSLAALGLCVLLLSNVLMPVVGLAETTKETTADHSVELPPIEDPGKKLIENLESTSEKNNEQQIPGTDVKPPVKEIEVPALEKAQREKKESTRSIGDEVDYNNLSNAYSELIYGFMDEADQYTTETWQPFITIFNKITPIMEILWDGHDETLTYTQAEVDQLEDELAAAKNALVLKDVTKDISQLVTLVQLIESKQLVAADYTDYTWEQLTSALENGQIIIAEFAEGKEDNYTQKMILDQIAHLDYCYQNLRERIKNPISFTKTVTIPEGYDLASQSYIVEAGEGLTLGIHQSNLETIERYSVYLFIDGVELQGQLMPFGEELTFDADYINDLILSKNLSRELVSTSIKLTVLDGRSAVVRKESMEVIRYNVNAPTVLDLGDGYSLRATYAGGDSARVEMFFNDIFTNVTYIYANETLNVIANGERVEVTISMIDDPNVSKSQLDYYLNVISSLDRRDFSETTWQVLTIAYVSAKAVLDDETSTQATVDQHVASLIAALKQLAYLGAELETLKEDLDTLISYSEDLRENRHTPETWVPYQAAVAQAKKIRADETSGWYDLYTAYLGLDDAWSKLVWLEMDLDFTELAAIIATAQAIKEENYSVYSWNSLQYAIESGIATIEYLKDDEYEDYLQDMIDNDTAEIQKAIDNLREKIVSTKTVTYQETLTGTTYYFGQGSQKELILDNGMTAYLSDRVGGRSTEYSVDLIRTLKNGEKQYVGNYIGTFGKVLNISNEQINDEIEMYHDDEGDPIELLATSYAITINDSRDKEKIEDIAVELDDFGNSNKRIDIDGDTLTLTYDITFDRVAVLYHAAQFVDFIGFFDDGDTVTLKTKTGLVKLTIGVKRVSTIERMDLGNLLDILSVYNTNGYTEESVNKLSAEIESARDIFNNLTASQLEVDQAQARLQGAFDSLVAEEDINDEELVVEYLVSAIDELQELEQGDYTPESWQLFSKQLAIYVAVLNKYNQPGRVGSRLEQAEIDSTVFKLYVATSLLTEVEQGTEKPEQLNLVNLTSAISKAEALKANDYTEKTWEVVANDLVNAKTVLEKAQAQNRVLLTQTEVDAAADKLLTSLTKLEKKPVVNVNLTALKQSISEAKVLNSSLYTITSWEIMTGNLALAESFVNDVENGSKVVTQAEVDLALANLKIAVDNLVLKPDVTQPEKLDVSKLGALITKADGLVELDYTVASWQHVALNLKAAKKVYQQASDQTEDEAVIIQADIDSMVTILQNAIDQLVKKEDPAIKEPLNTKLLQERIKEAQGKVENQYTAASWQKLVAELKVATTVLERAEAQNEQRSLLTQEDVDLAEANLAKGIKGLVKLTATDLKDPTEPTEPKEPTKPTEPKDKGKDDKGNKQVKSDGKNLPQTGSVTSIMPNVVGMGTLLASIAAYLKGRRTKK